MDATKDYLLTKPVFCSFRLSEFTAYLRKRRAEASPTKSTIAPKDDEPKPNGKHEWALVDFQSLPAWLQCNEFLLGGHRPPIPSLSACFQSVFCLHTETMNIWTHAVPSFIFLFIFFYNYSLPDEEFSLMHKIGHSPFVVGFTICFGFSATFHAICCHSQPVYNASCLCDYLGIFLAMLGALYSAMFYQWWCQWHIGIAYCLFYTAITPFAWSVFRSSMKHTGKKGKYLRAFTTLGLGTSAISSLFHEGFLNGWAVVANYPVGHLGIIFLMGIMAVFLYSTRIPERFWPGKFDIWFHSHQLFHLIVAGVGFVGYDALLSIAEFRKRTTNTTECDFISYFGLQRVENFTDQKYL